jgi:hypothetical protein
MVPFALLALVAVRKGGWRSLTGPRFDEREREISRKVLLASFRAMGLAVIGLIVTLGLVKGSDATLSLPMWKLWEALFWLWMLMLGVQAVATLVLYRRGSDA